MRKGKGMVEVVLREPGLYNLSITDVEILDGERISVYQNEEKILDNVMIGDGGLRIPAYLENEHFVEIHATGYGAEPPLTLKFVVENNEGIILEQRIDMNLNEKVRFITR